MEYSDRFRKVTVLGAGGKMGSGILLLTATEICNLSLARGKGGRPSQLIALDVSTDALRGVRDNLRTQVRRVAEKQIVQLRQWYDDRDDLIFKSIDLPYSDEIAERLKAMLPPQIQQTLQEDGQDLPPEVMQAMQQAEQAMQQAQEYGQLVQAASAELEGEKAEDKVAKAGIQTDLANLEKAKAQFDTHIAKETAGMIERESGMTTRAAEISLKGAELKEKAIEQGKVEIGGMVDQVKSQQDVGKIDGILSDFMGQVDQAVGGMSAKSAELERRSARKVTGGKTHREGGKLTATVQYDDGSERSLSTVKQNGETVILPEDSEA